MIASIVLIAIQINVYGKVVEVCRHSTTMAYARPFALRIPCQTQEPRSVKIAVLSAQFVQARLLIALFASSVSTLRR